MNFTTKQTIENLLKDVIQNLNVEERHTKILELKCILKFIDSIESCKGKFKGVKSVHVLPESKTGYSEYRILDDTDTDNRLLWIELENLRLYEGDLLIKLKT